MIRTENHVYIHLRIGRTFYTLSGHGLPQWRRCRMYDEWVQTHGTKPFIKVWHFLGYDAP